MGDVDEIALVERPEKSNDVAVEILPVPPKKKEKKQKPKRYNRTPASYYQVILIGVFVLLIIIGCVAFETYHSRLCKDKNSTLPNDHTSSEEEYHRKMVHRVNNGNGTKWKAKYNRFATRVDLIEHASLFEESSKSIAEKLGAHKGDLMTHLMQDTAEHVRHLQSISMTIPDTFDSRLHWSLCWSTHQIFNQAGCGSCWSVSATSVMSDRLCIASNSTNQKQISALDLTSCCHTCGGCQGTHWALSAFSYWKEHGIVSGGSYGTHEGCRPYSFEPKCGYPCKSTEYRKDRTPVCEKKCIEEYDKDYTEDIIKSSKAYWLRAFHGSAQSTAVRTTLDKLVGKNDKSYEVLIQKEILLYGPVLGCFTLAEDIQHYSHGIYSSQDISAGHLYGHCAKLLGWGVENGAKYWLYANTWGRNWGENGFFRVAFDELPEEVVAGIV